MEAITKMETESAMIHLNGFQIAYHLLHDDNGWYGIACSCKKSGHVTSDYINPSLFSARTLAEQTFHILVENAVFPVHIPDILSDLCLEEQPEISMAIA